MVVKWRFDDPVTDSTYTFEINPVGGGSPNYQKNFQYVAPIAPDGQTIIFEGKNQPQKIEFEGTLLSEAQYNAFVNWWRKKYQVQVTDDLGREFMIVIESFDPSRVRARSHPWKHTYKVAATVVDWPS